MDMQTIVISQNDIKDVDHESEVNSVLRLIMDKIVISTFRGGVTVSLKVGKERVPLSKEGEKLINEKWLKAAKKDLIYLLLYGMTPVLMKKEKLENGTTISYPVIPMKGSFGFQFIIDEYGQPNFQVLKLINGPMNIGGGNIGIGNNVWEEAFILFSESYEPSTSGRLSSPVRTTFRDLKRLNTMWKRYMTVVHQNTKRPYVYELPSASNEDEVKKALIDSISNADYETTGDGEKEIKLDDKRAQEMQNAIDMSKKFNPIDNGTLSTIAEEAKKSFGELCKPKDEEEDLSAPWKNFFWIPQGLKLANNVPVPSTPPDFLTIIKFIISMITNSFQISDQVAENSKKTTSSSSFTETQFNSLIKSYQTVIKTHMEQLLNNEYKDVNLIIEKGSLDSLNDLDLGEISESEMKEILSDIKLEFSFNDESTVDVKEIIELFKSGLLPKRIAQTKILPRFGVDPEECAECEKEEGQAYTGDDIGDDLEPRKGGKKPKKGVGNISDGNSDIADVMPETDDDEEDNRGSNPPRDLVSQNSAKKNNKNNVTDSTKTYEKNDDFVEPEPRQPNMKKTTQNSKRKFENSSKDNDDDVDDKKEKNKKTASNNSSSIAAVDKRENNTKKQKVSQEKHIVKERNSNKKVRNENDDVDEENEEKEETTNKSTKKRSSNTCSSIARLVSTAGIMNAIARNVKQFFVIQEKKEKDFKSLKDVHNNNKVQDESDKNRENKSQDFKENENDEKDKEESTSDAIEEDINEEDTNEENSNSSNNEKIKDPKSQEKHDMLLDALDNTKNDNSSTNQTEKNIAIENQVAGETGKPNTELENSSISNSNVVGE